MTVRAKNPGTRCQSGPIRVRGPRALPWGPMADDESKQSIRMTADRILVTPSVEHGERKSRAGILIPATADVSRRLVWAKAVAVGPTVRNVEEGDRVTLANSMIGSPAGAGTPIVRGWPFDHL